MRLLKRRKLRTPSGWTSQIAKDELDVDPVVAAILANSAPGEGAAIDALVKAGGDEAAVKALAVALRSWAAIENAYTAAGQPVPAELRKARDELFGGAKPTRPPMLRAVPDPKPPRSGDELLADARRLQKAGDANAERWLEQDAARLRKADPKLSEAQSIAKALDRNPDLYTAIQRHKGLITDGGDQ